MPVRKRNLRRRGALSADEEAWLRGDTDCGFVQFMDCARLEALWNAYGDKEAFEWTRSMYLPKRRLS
ncbi:hypothetical protein V1290_004411 [Bradyrhizobium sp. AZCC 1578]